jgi:hypothetical protein
MSTQGLLFKSAMVLAAWVAVSALATFTARRTLLRLPVDALHRGQRRSVAWHENAFGLALIGVGILLLFLPGPGVLLIVAGLLACDFPGRQKFLRWMLSRARVITEVNALRMRHGRAPLESTNAITPENDSSGVN